MWAWLLGCLRGSAPAEPPLEEPLRAAILSRVEAVYGAGGMGWNTGDDRAIQYVSVYGVESPRHWVYVTTGAWRWKHPHELVLRVAAPPGSGAPRFEEAPEWPVALLAEIGEVTVRTGESPRFGDYLRDLTLPDLPYRHVVYLRDDALQPVDGPAGFAAFVRVVPLTDAELAALDAIPEGAPMTFLRDWHERDAAMAR